MNKRGYEKKNQDDRAKKKRDKMGGGKKKKQKKKRKKGTNPQGTEMKKKFPVGSSNVGKNSRRKTIRKEMLPKDS